MTNTVFVVDGGQEVGLGHVYESTTLAKEVETVSDVVVVSLSDSAEVTGTLEQHGFVPTVIQESDLPNHLETLDPDTIVINLPWIDEKLVARIKSTLDSKLIAYGNTSTTLSPAATEYCDVVVTPNSIEDGFSGRSFMDENGTLHMIGPRYFVPRPGFYEYADSYETESLEHVLLMFGGSDPSNLTSWFLRDLLASGSTYDIDVVVGAGFSHWTELENVLNEYGTEHVSVYEDVDNVPQLMHESDFILTSPGQSSLEALFVGVPTLAIYQNESQKTAYQTAEFAHAKEDVSDTEAKIADIYNAFTREGREGYDSDIGTGKNEITETISETI